ncbi:MAG: hypothetical protein V2A61_03550, partial [Calditrichota bacterium]
VRPELAVLFLLIIIYTWFEKDRRKALNIGIAGLIINIPWLVYARLIFGSILPNPWLIKSDSGWPSIADLWLNINRTVKIALASNGIEIIMVLAVLGLLLTGTINKGRTFRRTGLRACLYRQTGRDARLPIFLIWVAILPLFYLARGVFVQSRYLLPIIPALILAAYLGMGFLLSHQLTNPDSIKNSFLLRRGLLILTTILAAQQLILTRQVTLPHAAAFQESIQALRRLADYLRLETPPESVVAVGDVGIIGFYSGRRIIDFEGLVTREIVPFRKGKSLDKFIQNEDFLKAGKPDYFIDKTREPGRMTKVNPDRYHILCVEPIRGAMVDNADESWFYTLYQVD